MLPYLFAHDEKKRWNVYFLTAACLSSIFTDFNSVPVLAVAWPAFFLIFAAGTQKKWVALSLVPLACCRAIGAADYFKDGMSGGVSWLICTGISLCFCFILMLCAVVQLRIWEQFPNFSPSPLAFPTVFAGIYQLWLRYSPIGAAGNPAMGLVWEPTLRQSVSLFGEIFLVFLVGWIASISAGLAVGRVSRGHMYRAGGVAAFLLVFGGIRMQSGRGMWLKDISEWPASVADPLQMSCITLAEDSHANTRETAPSMQARTNARLAAGDDYIVWSETACSSDSVAECRDLDWTTSTNPNSVVAITYEGCDNAGGACYNTVEQLQHGKNISRYNKNRPVPIIEAGITPGAEPPTPTTISFGTGRGRSPSEFASDNRTLAVANAICFDFDFPYLLQHAAKADLVVGPSWYWASIGNNIWGDNIFRAVENGFTLFKCSLNGMSGAVDPYGRTLASKPTTWGEVYTAQIPVQKHVWTLYAHGGYLFGWFCIPAALGYIALAIFAKKAQRHCPTWLLWSPAELSLRGDDGDDALLTDLAINRV